MLPAVIRLTRRCVGIENDHRTPVPGITVDARLFSDLHVHLKFSITGRNLDSSRRKWWNKVVRISYRIVEKYVWNKLVKLVVKGDG